MATDDTDEHRFVSSVLIGAIGGNGAFFFVSFVVQSSSREEEEEAGGTPAPQIKTA
jgi:hypothetical protein